MKKTRLRLLRLCHLGLAVFTAQAAANTASNDNSVPELLRFAQEYNQDNQPAVDQAKPATKNTQREQAQRPVRKGVLQQKEEARQRTLQQKIAVDKEIERQRELVAQLRKENDALKQQQSVNPPPLETVGKTPQQKVDLQEVVQNLRQAITIAPSPTQREKELAQLKAARLNNQKLADENQRLASKNETLQTALKLAHTESKALVNTATQQSKAELQALAEKNQAITHEMATLQQQKDSLFAENQSITAKLKSTEAETTALSQERDGAVSAQQQLTDKYNNQASLLAALTQEKNAREAAENNKPTATTLKDAKVRRDYIIGLSLGRDIIEMQLERQQWGITSNKDTLLAGITDQIYGNNLIDDKSALADLEKYDQEFAVAKEKTLTQQSKEGEKYLANFKKSQGAKQAPSGFWYRIEYAGDDVIPDTAAVDVVVKESLTNGNVIQDMESNNAVLSQPVESFPPIFKEAIKLLKNHGSITLVVPPEQAYGDKGYPPKIPPNATMVYHLRVVESYPNKTK